MGTLTETRWLTAEEQRAWRAYLESTKVLFDALDRQLQREAGMPHAYYEILVRLSEADGRALRMSELADSTLSSRSRLSHAVARLEERVGRPRGVPDRPPRAARAAHRRRLRGARRRRSRTRGHRAGPRHRPPHPAAARVTGSYR